VISSSALRIKFVAALERDRKRLTGELKSVESQLAALSGGTKKVMFADTEHHRVDPRKGRKLSPAHRRAIQLGIKKSRAAVKAKSSEK